MMGVAAVAAGNLPHQRQPQPHVAGLLGMAVHPIYRYNMSSFFQTA